MKYGNNDLSYLQNNNFVNNKRKYINLKYGGTKNNKSHYTKKEKDFIKNEICCLVHATSPSSFKKIMKDGYLKPSSLTSIKETYPDRPDLAKALFGVNRDVVYFTVLSDKSLDYIEKPDPSKYLDTKKIFIVMNKKMLYDKDIQEEYIDKLGIPDTLKPALITYLIDTDYVWGDAEYHGIIDNVWNKINPEKFSSPYWNELIVFNNVDVNKYITKIVCTKKNYRKIKKYIPKNIEVVFI